MISLLDIDDIEKQTPALARDIYEKVIRKYTKYGILQPSELDLHYIKRIERSIDIKVVSIIDSHMFYKDQKLEMTNYIYIGDNHIPSMDSKGLKINAIVSNRTWKIEGEGLICIDEINGNLIRVY